MIRAIIVDDEQWTRDIIKRFGSWQELDMEIVGGAEDGLEAERLIQTFAPQLVITDMHMPGAGGVELLKYLNENHPEIKIIVVSGYDDFEFTRHAIRYKVNEYLLKPIDAAELNHALGKCKAELEAEPAGSGGYVPFDADIFQLIKRYKLLLSVHFHELNEEGIRHVLDAFLQELQSGGYSDKTWMRQLYQEFLSHLKELMVSNSVELGQVEFDSELMLPGLEGMVQQLGERYLTSLQLLIQQRKFRNKLNLDEIKTFIDYNFAESISLEKVARSFFVSKEYLSKIFKQEFGQNMTDYVQQVRMIKAKEWILQGIPIKTVAEMCGYEELGYFYRVFKKQHGIAPGELRKGTHEV